MTDERGGWNGDAVSCREGGRFRLSEAMNVQRTVEQVQLVHQGSFKLFLCPCGPLSTHDSLRKVVEHSGLEPLTPTMPLWCSTN